MATTINNKNYGWHPSLPDARDHQCLLKVFSLPSSIDLRPACPKVRDQGQLGSCTAFATGSVVQFNLMKQGLKSFETSSLFQYYNSRLLEGTIDSDSGATIRDSIKAVNLYGAVSEAVWWYNIVKFTVKPNKKVYAAAALHKALKYQAVSQNLNAIQSVLASGYTVVIGFTVYDSFESQDVANTGLVPMPNLRTESVLGGHAVVIVGYDNATQKFICRNSWSVSWGDKGYFYMPYAYLLNPNLAGDFWTIQAIV